MKVEFKNNQYLNDGSYRFPDKETKIINITLDRDEFLQSFIDVLSIPKRLQNLFMYIIKNKDKSHRFNYMDKLHLPYYISEGISIKTVKNYMSLLTQIKYCNHKLIIRKTSHVYELNKEFTFHWERNVPTSFIIEYTYKV